MHQDPQPPRSTPSPSLPDDHIFGGPAARQPAPRRRRATSPLGKRQASGTRRVICFEASAAVHLAIFLLMMGIPMPQAAPKEAVREVVPIEVAFVPQPMAPQPKVAPPGPAVKPEVEPLPKAPEKPAPRPQPQQAAAPRPLPPRPADVSRHVAPKPAQRELPKPKQPDLQALLNARMNAGRTQDEQRLSHLRDTARDGGRTSATQPANGTPMGSPTTGGSGLSGALASRQILRRLDPAYPAEAQRIGEEGEVTLRLWVNAAGAVIDVDVRRSSGRGYFDRAAASAVRGWAFNALPDAAGGKQFGDVTMYFKLQ